MNLSLILNPATAAAAPGMPAAAPVSPEMASFQDFLALVGLPPMQADGGEDELPEVAADGVDADVAALTGNILPPALPVLPPVDAETPAAEPRPAATIAANAIVQAQMAGLPLPPGSAQHLLADAKDSPATHQKPAAVANPASATVPPAALAVTIEAVAPADAQPRAASQPVLAQLLQSQQVATPTMGGAKAARRDEAIASLGLPAAPNAAPVASAETARPVAQVSAADTQSQPDLPMALIAGSPQAVTTTATVAAANEAEPAGHDFAAVVDRLTEARELARPGRADLHLTHREFGAVSVQFELTGQSLKVAMSSPDQAFAPAVQAALAERPLPVADVSRTDTGQPRTDAVNPSAAAFHAGTQADSQRGQGQQAAASQRGLADQPSARASDGETDQTSEAGADKSGRFA